MKKLLLTLLLFSAGTGISAAKTYDLKSPDGKIAVRVDVGADAVTYSISRDGKELIAPSPLSLTLADGRVLGRKKRRRNHRSALLQAQRRREPIQLADAYVQRGLRHRLPGL